MTDQTQISELEKLAAQAPSAVDLAKKQRDENDNARQLSIDKANRMVCIENATRACSAGGYEIDQVLRLTRGFYTFLTGKAVPHDV